MRHATLIAATAALLLAGAGCPARPVPAPAPSPAPVPPAVNAPAPSAGIPFGKETTLYVGSDVTFEDGLNVTLLSMGDSRCPEHVQCVWQGELSPDLQLFNGAIGDVDKELYLGTVRATKAIVDGYAFALSRATPDSATFVVKKADGAGSVQEMVRVTAPSEGDVVKSPLVVKGEARGVWYFEAQFPVRLLDADGRVIASAPAHATGDWMTDEFVPFTATLDFDAPASSTGTLVLEKDNPSDLPQNADSRSIPVRFRAGAVPASGSGVRGTVTLGPTCPVERVPPEPRCAPKPYAAALRIRTRSGTTVARVQAGEDGTFSQALSPGDYVIGSAASVKLPRLADTPFTVKSGAMTSLDLRFDSGIR